jgi:acetyl esterase/lipase
MKITMILISIVISLSTTCIAQVVSNIDMTFEEITKSYTIEKDIAYGLDTLQKMDIYISNAGNKLASKEFTVIFIHGGAWYLSDKLDVQRYILPYLKKGINVVNMNFRLKKGIPIASEDLTNALNFLWENNLKYPLNLKKVILSGFSAGGHMAALIGLSANNKNYFYKLLNGIKIAGIIDFAGPVDRLDVVEKTFMNWDFKGEWITKDLSVKDLGNAMFPSAGYISKDATVRLEPITYFDKKDPPFFLWHGGKDDQIIPSTLENFIGLFKKYNNKNVEIFDQNYGHSPNTLQLKEAYEKIFIFLDTIR